MKEHESNGGVQKEGYGALQNLACNDDNKKTIAKEGGIKVALDAMKRHKKNCDVQDNDDNKKTIAKDGCEGGSRRDD